jgi:hypothetical protein
VFKAPALQTAHSTDTTLLCAPCVSHNSNGFLKGPTRNRFWITNYAAYNVALPTHYKFMSYSCYYLLQDIRKRGIVVSLSGVDFILDFIITCTAGQKFKLGRRTHGHYDNPVGVF